MTKILTARNVCEALVLGVEHLLEEGVHEESRAGPVIVAPGPVLTETQYPRERVLFSAVRDANPFFHLREALWMLAGRDDAKSLTPFVKDFARYAENDGRVHGSYGRRWRSAFGFDQLQHVIDVLRKDPQSRQCVIQMWDSSLHWPLNCPTDAREYAGESDLTEKWKDRPCNTHVYLRVRRVHEYDRDKGEHDASRVTGLLDLTVCCRSNDAIWGAHGANAVHFSVLQEYLAARIGVSVGAMYQLSNNYHMYSSEWSKLRFRASEKFLGRTLWDALRDNGYETLDLETCPIFDVPDEIDADLQRFEKWCDKDSYEFRNRETYANSWFACTATPVILSHMSYREGKKGAALAAAYHVEASDWRVACVEWLKRRIK